MFSIFLWLAIIGLFAFAVFGGRFGRIATLVVLAVAGVISVAATVYALNYFSTEQTIETYLLRITSALGISPLLAKSIAILAVLPAGTAIAWSASGDSWKKNVGRYGLALCASAYYGLLAFVGNDLRLSQNGQALQCYVIAEDQVIWRDISFLGIDPPTGRECVSPTPSIIPTLAKLNVLLRSGGQLSPFDPKGRYFNSIGEPVVWFSQTQEGLPEFYEYPGFHPKTGTKLEPITKEKIVFFDKLLAKKKLSDERVRLSTEKINRRDQLQAYVVAPKSTNKEKVVGLVIVPAGSALGSSATSKQMELFFAKIGYTATTLFSPVFFSAPYYSELKLGPKEVLTDSGVFERVAFVLIGTIATTCGKALSQPGLVSCELQLGYSIIGAEGETIASGDIREKAPGTTENAAATRAAELLLERHFQEIIKQLNLH
jgi:hypothetical protein